MPEMFSVVVYLPCGSQGAGRGAARQWWCGADSKGGAKREISARGLPFRWEGLGEEGEATAWAGVRAAARHTETSASR
eukprot:1736049-Prymnesium_polylepis.1